MNSILVFILLIGILLIGRPILIPFFIAVFLWYLINAIASYYRKILPFKNPNDCKHCCLYCSFNVIATVLSIATIGAICVLFVTQVKPMFSELTSMLPDIQNRLIGFGDYLSKSFGITFDASLLPNITGAATKIGSSLANIATSIGMILIYMLFLFFEQGTFRNKIFNMFSNPAKSRKLNFILNSIDKNMKKYLFMKTLISAATGICGYIWLRALGLEFAGIWAFMLFILNYIPTIGSIIACGMPIVYALIAGGGLPVAIPVAIGLIGIQIIFGNILDPKLTGKTLNLSTLAILLNLVFWGLIWGIAGMFFSVPILVAIYITVAQFDSTRWIAVLLSADGNIPDKSE
ncbi:MAG: AI-2E family transporter [Alphaproteobacteria bacterium]|nr:AI-2E family transporter [Alphaproteobacteria bacterium]